MKIVILTPRVPEILDKGDKLRIFHQIKFLSTSNEIHLISLSTSKKRKVNPELKQFIKSFHVISSTKLNRIFNLFYYSIFKKLPFQVSYYFSKKNKSKIDKIISNIEPQLVYCQLIRTSEFVKYRKEVKIIDFMDCFSLGLKRRIKKSSIFFKKIVNVEYKRVKNYETKIFDHFNFKTIISEFDKKNINHENRNQIVIVKNGIDLNYFKRKSNNYNKKTIIFVGNMSYKPNILAAKFICEKILPLVNIKIKNTKVIIAGSSPTDEVKKLSKLNKNIKVTGFISDIRTAYEKGTVFIAPMFIGSGLQNKLLEAMSMRIPCITTEIANNSLNATENEIIIAKNEFEFANSCIDLFNNNQKTLKLIENGYKFVKTKYCWEKSTNVINKIIKNEIKFNRRSN